MKKNTDIESAQTDVSCVGTNAKNLWMIGMSVVALATLFCFAIFSVKNKPVPAQDPASPVMAMGTAGQPAAFSGGNCMTYPSFSQSFPQGSAIAQQAAFVNPSCVPCPSFTQCFPQGTSGAQQVAFVNPSCVPCPSFTQCFPQGTTGAQQVAFANPNCMACPNFNQCFPQGASNAQQAAIANPNCMTCPNFTQCFPQGTTGGQQLAFGQGAGQGYGIVSCPFCSFAYNDAYAGIIGASRCPRCFGSFPFSSLNRGGFTNIALTQPIAAPPIFRDAVMPHEYRGVCENCHQIKPDIAIPASAQMPHEYRGVCSNCHTILGAKAGAQ